MACESDAHSFEPGDAVWVKEWDVQPLKPLWRGRFTVILFTPTAVQIAEVGPWIHYSRVKLESQNWECIPDPSMLCKVTVTEEAVYNFRGSERLQPSFSHSGG